MNENLIAGVNEMPFIENVSVEKGDVIKSKETKYSLEQMLKDNLSCEMFHFVLNVFYSPHLVIKCILAFFILVACGLASYTTITLVLTYMEYNVITTTRIINETPAVFPKVTICNKNPFTSRNAFEFLSESNFLNMSRINETLNGDRTLANQYFARLRAGLFGQIQNMPDEKKKKFSHDLNDTLLSCLFSYQPCNSDDFEWKWDSNYGNCFVFNSEFNSSGQKVELRKSSIGGNIYGLQIEMYVNFYEYLKHFDFILESYDSGLVIRFDNVSHVVDYSYDGIFISPGYRTYLALDRQFKTSLWKPYSNCDDLSDGNFKSDLFKLISHSKYSYTQKFCLQQCFQELIYKECDCLDSDFASLRNANFCMTDVSIECAWKAWLNIYVKNDYIQDICLPQCPLECNSTQITFTLSFTELLPSMLVNVLKRNPNLSSDFINRSIEDETIVLQSVVKLNIFYNSLSYTISTESPQMDLISLIANIGGNLGLFMGVCLFSLAEIIVTLIELAFIKYSTNKKVKKEAFFNKKRPF